MYRLLPLIMLCFWACSKPNPNQDLAQELWDSFDQHYAFFELRKIDWAAQKDSLFLESQAATNEAELFDVFCKYLQRFGDSHVNLISDSLRIQCNGAPDPAFFQEFPTDSSFQALLEVRDSTLRDLGITQLRETPSGLFQYGSDPNGNWGYLRIRRFYGLSEVGLEAELDSMMVPLRQQANLILDIRTNPGGNDPTALRIAERFFPERQLGYFKQSRNGPGHEDFSELESYWIEPQADNPPYQGPIYLLLNEAAGSAADVFALLLYQRDKVIRVGTNTEGIFSDMYRDTLSNGWAITLSHQRYYSAQMELFEGIGVPTEYDIANTKGDLERGFDPLIRVVQQIHDGTLGTVTLDNQPLDQEALEDELPEETTNL